MSRLIPRLLVVCGWISLGLGAAGLALPVLPTVPFVLLAAVCFMRGSGRHYRWLVSHPLFGPHVADYLAGKGLRPRVKALALVTLWAAVLTSTCAFVPLLAVDLALLAIAALVSAYILRLPSSGRSG